MEDAADPAAELRDAQRRLRKRMAIALAIALLAAAAGGALIYWWTRPGPEIPPIARPYLWEVTTPGGGPPSYLFGTVHIGYAVTDLPRVVRDAQERSAITVLESDLLDEPAPPAAPPIPIDEPTGPTGRARLTDREWARLAKMTGRDEDHLVPLATSDLLGLALISQAPARIEAMDRGLQKRAVALGKELVFLETRKLDQVMDDGVLLDGLVQIIAHPRLLRRELLGIVRRYASGAPGGCNQAPEGGKVRELTSGLNETWGAGIETQLRRGGAFVAIGCAHLDGPQSIVARLEAGGFQLRRVDR